MSTPCTSVPTSTRTDTVTVVRTETVVSPSVSTFALSTLHSTSFGCVNRSGTCSPTSTLVPSTVFGSTTLSVTRTTTLTTTSTVVGTLYSSSCPSGFRTVSPVAVTNPPSSTTNSTSVTVTHVTTHVVTAPVHIAPQHLGVIIGGTVGSLVALVALGLLIWAMLAWNKRRAQAKFLPMPYPHFPMRRQFFAKSPVTEGSSRDPATNVAAPPPPYAH